MEQKQKCVIILSSKSAGSTALQTLVCRFGGGQHVQYTRHAEFETLYWAKAASILGMPQVALPDSELPIRRAKAERHLRRLLALNVPDFTPPSDPWLLALRGWGALCRRFGPTFVEKSPHHLHLWSAMELMERAATAMPDVDFHFIGLVRNPMDVLYSAWRRWRTRPDELQFHWQMAYENLRRWQEIAGPRLHVVRYEDFAARPDTTARLFDALGLTQEPAAEKYIHGDSRHKWKSDRWFRFQLDPRVAATAQSWGYTQDEIYNRAHPIWAPYSRLVRLGRKLQPRPLVRARRGLRRLRWT